MVIVQSAFLSKGEKKEHSGTRHLETTPCMTITVEQQEDMGPREHFCCSLVRWGNLDAQKQE